MNNLKLKRNIIATFTSKVAILLLNFAILIITTQLWGASGRGIISIFVADLGLIAIFTNVFTSSSVSYYISKLGKSKLMSHAYLFSFIISGIIAAILSFFDGNQLTLFLFVTAAFLGFVTFHNSLFIGTQKINYFNLITVLQPLLLLLFTLAFHVLFAKSNLYTDRQYYSYFYGQIVSIAIILVICHILTRKAIHEKLHIELDKNVIHQSFNFGWQTELSNLLQFFNYRMSYYFLEYFSGMSSVGIFSVGVTLSEAIWTVSKSISVVQYSNVLEQGDNVNTRHQTVSMSKISFYTSLACIIVVLLLPKSIFPIIFGKEFIGVKKVMMYLAPGILAIAVSNVYGNYFSAIGKLKILIAKSAIGLVVTILLSYLLIPRLSIDGACIVNSTSYLVSSAVIIWYFFIGRKS